MAPAPTVRLFVAVFPPAEVAQRLSEAARELSRGLDRQSVGWTSTEQIHVTLNFLGGVEPGRIGEIERFVDGACQRGKCHLLQARGLGCFPSPARPRIIWAGLTGRLAALESLKRDLDARLAPLGFASEERAFHPHLTLGRVKTMTGDDRRRLAGIWPRWRETEFGAWTVARVDLMQSALLPSGARYTCLQSFHLTGGSTAA